MQAVPQVELLVFADTLSLTGIENDTHYKSSPTLRARMSLRGSLEALGLLVLLVLFEVTPPP